MVQASIATLTCLGFSPAVAERALQLEGGDRERAANRLFTNPASVSSGLGTVDADNDEPVTVVAERSYDPALAQLVSMGFDGGAAARVLSKTHGDVNVAMETLLAGGELQGTLPAQRRRTRRRPAPNSSASIHVNASRELQAALPEIDTSGRPASSDEPEFDTSRQPASASSAPRDTSGSEPAQSKKTETIHTVAYLSADLAFGPAAFGQLRSSGVMPAANASARESVNVKKVLEASVDGVKKMKGQRGEMFVTDMLHACYTRGLWQHGPESSPVNSQIIPATRHIFAEFSKLPAKDKKRVTCLTELAFACQDCQQVQAREILRIYGDLTAQNETFEGQLRYSLVRQKEAALDRYISRHHPNCDKSHTDVNPWQQRAHLISGYVALVGDEFGFDGVTAARSDRFLAQVQNEMGRTKPANIIAELKGDMCPKEWLQTLLADINNQTSGSARLINRDCIFKWVQANMSDQAAYLVFYDEDRAAEFDDLDPKQPLEENRYQPFLSVKVLVDMLLKAGMLEKNNGEGKKITKSARGRFRDFIGNYERDAKRARNQ